MNKDITALYTIVLNNEVIAFGNMLDIHNTLKNVEPEARNYQFYYREFKKYPKFKWSCSDKDYHFQKLV